MKRITPLVNSSALHLFDISRTQLASGGSGAVVAACGFAENHGSALLLKVQEDGRLVVHKPEEESDLPEQVSAIAISSDGKELMLADAAKDVVNKYSAADFSLKACVTQAPLPMRTIALSADNKRM